VLAFDGRTAWISTATGLVIADVGVHPRVLGSLEIGDRPLSSAFVDDHLYLSTESEVDVVYPPCPPP
jgi:hypothetical protein